MPGVAIFSGVHFESVTHVAAAPDQEPQGGRRLGIGFDVLCVVDFGMAWAGLEIVKGK